jgi:hypothetical protein
MRTRLLWLLLLLKRLDNRQMRLQRAGMVLTRRLMVARPNGSSSRSKPQKPHRLYLISAGRPMELSALIPLAPPAVVDEVAAMGRVDSLPVVTVLNTEVALVAQRAIAVAHRTAIDTVAVLTTSLLNMTIVVGNVLAEPNVEVELVLTVPLKIVL